jgi:hypothetical protein
MSVVIDINSNLNIKDLGRNIGKRVIVLTENDLITNLKKNTPIKTGTARAGWHKDSSDFESRVYNDVKYMKFLDQGTGIYGPRKKPIIRTSKNGLKFEVKGGIKPTKTVEKSVPETTKRINEFAQIAIRESLG